MEIKNIQIGSISAEVNNDRASNKKLPTQKEIQNWIVNHIAELLEVNPNRINATSSFDRYGLDSVIAVSLTGDLEDWLGTELDPTLLYDYPTIERLAHHLAEELEIATYAPVLEERAILAESGEYHGK